MLLIKPKDTSSYKLRLKTNLSFLWLSLFDQSCENPLNYNLSKINKVPNKLNKRIPSIVIGYNRIKYKMLR
jgi:hypothetical protein